MAENTIFILPCDQGGEVEFLHNSEMLQELFPCANGKPPENVYSCIEVKGMEFSAVIMCGFGEKFARQFSNQNLEQFCEHHPDQRNLELEYFLNKLYVAVSRSTKVLGIIDTELGDRYLWQAVSPLGIEHWLRKLPPNQRQVWDSQTSSIGEGCNLNVFRQSNPHELAQIYMRDGLEQKSQRFLETAIFFYDRANQTIEAEYCRAWVLRLEGKDLREAGLRFVQIKGLTDSSLNPLRDAWECFWEGQHWKDILAWCDRFPKEDNSRLRPIAVFMRNAGELAKGTENIKPLLDLSSFLLSYFSSLQTLASNCTDSTWQGIFKSYRQGIGQMLTVPEFFPADGNCWLTWQQTLSAIGETSFAHDETLALAARCAYQDRRYDQAITLWEQCNEESHREHNEYFLAKAAFSPVPENIRWLGRAQQLESIVAIWQKEVHEINDQWLPMLKDLCHALEHYEHHLDLLEIEIQQSQWVRAIQRLENRTSVQDPAFDAKLRFKMLKQMANDKKLNPEVIELQAKQQYLEDKRLTETTRRQGKFTSRQGQEAIEIAIKMARTTLCNFVARTTELQEWEVDTENITEAGAAFDRIGEFIPTLKFYERFRSGATQKNCELARSKWVEVKYRQANYSERTGRLDLASQQRQDADRFVQMWQCNPLITPITPAPPLMTPPLSDLNDLSTDTLRQKVSIRLENLSESELHQVTDYIRFLDFQSGRLS